MDLQVDGEAPMTIEMGLQYGKIYLSLLDFARNGLASRADILASTVGHGKDGITL